jgi:hypothetical protein
MHSKQRLTKRRIALIQLEQSLNLLESGDPVSALTFAGAAEEILGSMASRKGHKTRVEYCADWLGSLYDLASKSRPPKKKLISLLNETRNHLKHQDDGRNVKVAADFQFEAEEMILRCMFNHVNAFGRHPAAKRLVQSGMAYRTIPGSDDHRLGGSELSDRLFGRGESNQYLAGAREFHLAE